MHVGAGLPLSASLVGSGKLRCSYSWHVQVEIPECGARLLMGSKAFWHSIPLKQSVKNMRPKSAREVPTALQMVAIKKAVQQHPTIIVADLLPASSVTNKLDFQHLQEQQVRCALLQPLCVVLPT